MRRSYGTSSKHKEEPSCRELTRFDRSNETDEVFFVQNAGAKNASTGLKKSSIIEKISLADAAAVSHKSNAVGLVNVSTVSSSPMVINPNGKFSYFLRVTMLDLTAVIGGTNYRGQIIFAGEGQGDNKPPSLWVMNPQKPYNTTGPWAPRGSLETQLMNIIQCS